MNGLAEDEIPIVLPGGAELEAEEKEEADE